MNSNMKKNQQPPPKTKRAGVPLVQVRNLRKTFQEGVDEKGNPIDVRALRGVSFDIPPGKFIAITGPNGSGKSTLINCLGAFEKADPSKEDPIQYADGGKLRSVWQAPDLYRQNFVGIVFQDFHLLPTLRVDQNVEFPLRLRQCRLYNDDPEDRQKRVTDVLQRLGIVQHQNKKVSQISGGERQRVAIARALVKEPQLLLADEPTGNLDQQNKYEIVRQLKNLARGNLSVLMVTHDHELAERFADRIINLIDGKIARIYDRDPAKSNNWALQELADEGEPDTESARGEADDIADLLGDPVPESSAEPALAIAGAEPASPVVTQETSAPLLHPEAGQAPAAPAPGVSTTVRQIDGSGPPDQKESNGKKRRGGAATLKSIFGLAAGSKDKEDTVQPPPKAGGRRGLFAPLLSQSFPDIIRYSLRDARASTVSLASNVFAILLGTFLTAMLLTLLGGTEEYIRHLFRTIPGIDSVRVWVDYSAGEAPLSDGEVRSFKDWPGAQTTVPSVNQFVPIFQKPTREVIAALFSTQTGDPEVKRLELVTGSLEVDPEGWDVILPMRVAEEIDNFNPQGLVGKTITLQLRRYDKTTKVEGAEPAETQDYPLRVVGIIKASPEDRVYGSLAMVRFVRDFSTGRSDFMPEKGGRVDPDRISPRTRNESLRIHFGSPAAAEQAFLQMKQDGKQRFEVIWPGEKMLYLRDVETVSTIVLIGIGLLAIVAGAVSIFNTLLASVARKTKEIGIMRALGVARMDIFLIFLSQSVIIGIIACIVGLIIAGAATIPLNAYVAQRWGQLADAMKAIGGLFQFSLPVALSLVVAVLGICLVAAFLPALRASGKTPMDALREP